MKLRSFFALIVSASMLMAACSESDDDASDPEDSTGSGSTTATAIILDQPTLTLEVGGVATLTATFDPADATGTISWASSDSSVAAVSSSGGVVAMSAGSANIVASCGSLTATCAVTVNEAGLHASLQGSNYYVVAMDYITYDEISANVIADLRSDDVNSCLYIWDSTYAAGTCSGVNAYGQGESWTSLTVESVGWSGFGICLGVNGDYTGINELSTITDNPSDYYLHIAMKSSVAASHAIKLEDVGSGFCVIGNNGQIESRDPDYALVSDGEWQHFDIPMTHFTDQGFAFSPEYSATVNVFIMLSGGTAGTPLDFDAVFFYKK